MAENLYFMANGFSSVTAFSSSTVGPTAESTGTAGDWCMLLQLATPASRQINVVEYGVSLSGSPAAAKLALTSSSTASTVSNTGIILPYNCPSAPTTLLLTASCGYNTAQVAPSTGVVSSCYDLQLLTTNTYVKQFPLAREPVVPVSQFLQVLINVPTSAVTAYCYVVFRE